MFAKSPKTLDITRDSGISHTTQQNYGIVEGYAMGLNESKKKTVKYFNKLFSSGAIVVAIYGIHDNSDSPYMVPKIADAPFSQAVRQMIGSN